MTLPRYAPELPLPPYAYVPGKLPHPISDPRGHSYGQAAAPSLAPSEPWSESRAYRFGIDLFNHGYYWEAHEAWEAVWQAAGRSGDIADFLKGLIKLAAAGVKAREGNIAGIENHVLRAKMLLTHIQTKYADQPTFGHLHLDTLKQLCNAIFADPARMVDTSDTAVVSVYSQPLLWHNEQTSTA